MEHVFRLYDFNIYNQKNTNKDDDENEDEDNSNNGDDTKCDNNFMIQMFGINEKGESCSILAEGFKPFFYVKVDERWTQYTKTAFLEAIKKKMGKYHENSICDCKIIKRKKLYGFDGGKEHKFIMLQFNNMTAFNKAKNLWYTPDRKLLKSGLMYADTPTYLYESNIPPLLRFFHIKDVSPSGWVALPVKKTIEVKMNKQTNCTHEFITDYKNILPLNENETRVPYKICSFDIEASSSHGDFPIPVKSYKKLATNIIEYFEQIPDVTPETCETELRRIIQKAFGFYPDNQLQMIDTVYPKKTQMPKDKEDVQEMIESWLTTPLEQVKSTDELNNQMTIESMFENMNNGEEEEEDIYTKDKPFKSASSSKKKCTIINVICDKKITREEKLLEINKSLCDRYSKNPFPQLEGDKVTFIGSTFLKAGETDPYLNHCIVLDTCGKVPVENCEIESYKTEREVLLAWSKIIQKENPDIIIGYNIFGFDYAFMFNRAEENGCLKEFLKLSKNKNEICCQDPFNAGKYKLEETTLQIASGQHELKYIKMTGRIQIDLYNYFRREENLTSYKLDYVAGHFIGDYVKSLNTDPDNNVTTIVSGNLMGLLEGSYVHFEEIGHSVDYYCDGAKFSVLSVNKETKSFTVSGKIMPDLTKKVRWCLAKDDVTPKDIFRMTNGSADDRAIIAKYCIQDCNLVHYLMNKVDVLTGFVEMAKICSVPISFLVLRGQGIKLTSYVAKKCREKRTLMPVMEKSEDNDGYEGAIVLDPKCDLYLDNPVACVDYASLYPSSMMSENLSHDSKVWTKEYDLNGVLITETGETDSNGNFIYDNLPGYEYVDVTYDTFRYVRKTPSAAAEKIKSGHKICRFAQFPDNARAIMPSILEELLLARKTTRKLIPLQTDDFMKNVLDKRQLGYKVTANSLYGQCGAKTSTFYDKDIAASTTATGRLLLTYAKKIIEKTYGNRICNTSKHGPVLTKAEYVYGDSVANYTPVYVKVNGEFNICTIEDLGNLYGNNNWVKCLELGKQEKEFCELQDVETWTDKGWTKLHRVIRHELASRKKMVRVLTHTGLVDVTDDHSLLKCDGTEVSPKDVQIKTELLHNDLPKSDIFYEIKNDKLYFNTMLDAAKCCYNYKQNNILFEIDFNPLRENCYYVTPIKERAIVNTPRAYLSLINDNVDICDYTYTNITELQNNKNKIKAIHEIQYDGYVYDLTTDNHHFAAGIGNMIVHNTDSVFFTFNLQTPEGVPIRGKDALEITIELAQEAGHLASSFLKGPHDLEYEKTFMPFCLLSKKRYVGMLYEHDPDKCKRKEMGIVLKRRDNAPIVKDIYGGIIDILMKQQDIKQAMEFLKSCLKNIVEENYPVDKLIITKSIRSGYKNPKQIAHKVLADRITARDPGNKPSSGDRIPFVYIHHPNKKALQGEKIETPTFIKEQNLKIDYSFYITNQIMKPVQQVFALVLEKIWIMTNKKAKLIKFKNDIIALQKSSAPDKYEDKLEDMKNKEVKALLFDEFLRTTNNKKDGNQAVTNFLQKKIK